MKQINKLLLLFVCIVVGVFSYSYFMGKDLRVLDDTSVEDVSEVLFSLDNASSEGNDPNVLNMNKVYENDVNTFEQLYEKSDLIAEVELVNRSQDINVVNSEVKVNKVWKGNEKESHIQIYEPFSFLSENSIHIFGTCLPMRENEMYLVFLKEEVNGKYNLVSGLYGKYHVDGDAYFETDGERVRGKDIQEYDMVDYQMSEERLQTIKDTLSLGGLDEDLGKQQLASYEKLQKLRETREKIRSSFDKLDDKNS